MNHNLLLSNTLDDSLSMEGFISDNLLNNRSQDLKKHYRLNGAIYLCKTDKLLKEKSFFLKKNIFAYVMNSNNSIDIDRKEDFELASLYLSQKP